MHRTPFFRNLLVLWLVPCCALASAQTADLDRAREAYARGLDAAEDGQWARALEEFTRSYDLSPTAVALYNRATALRALGRHRESRDALDALLTDHRDLEADLRDAAREMHEEEAARVATLAIDGLAPADVVRLDGRRVSAGAEIEVDAGEHALEVERDGRLVLAWSGSLAGGAIERLEIRDASRPIDESSDALLWILIGVGGAAAIGLAIAIAFAAAPSALDPRTEIVLTP
jgi:tetratricopeptide (TPR) repeat protein